MRAATCIEDGAETLPVMPLMLRPRLEHVAGETNLMLSGLDREGFFRQWRIVVDEGALLGQLVTNI